MGIEASFTPDVAWMWPAGLGAGYVDWDSTLRVFNFGEEEHRFYAVAGSPEAGDIRQAYTTNYSSAKVDSFQFGPAVRGSATYHFVMVASFEGAKTGAGHLSEAAVAIPAVTARGAGTLQELPCEYGVALSSRPGIADCIRLVAHQPIAGIGG